MSTISEIQEAILALREPEFAELKRWFSALEAERRWKAWDEQIEADSEAGKLDFLVSEAMSLDKARDLQGFDWEGDLDVSGGCPGRTGGEDHHSPSFNITAITVQKPQSPKTNHPAHPSIPKIPVQTFDIRTTFVLI